MADKGSLFKSNIVFAQKLKSYCAIALARILKLGLRVFGRAGTALPGKAALKIQPELLSYLTANRQVYLVTGTNGKTTTVRVLCTLLAEQGYRIITNPSGANLDSGLTTTLIDNLKTLKVKTEMPVALVFEIDEAFFAKLAGQLNPAVCLVTNFFRDQLDRYGELQYTRDLIARGLDQTAAQIVLCADDSLCASLSKGREDRCRFFGMNKLAMHNETPEGVLESGFCTFCGTRYEYSAMAYGHLGIFSCAGCGFTRPEPELSFEVLNDPDSGPQSQLLKLSWINDTNTVDLKTKLSIPGIHNAYNATGAILAAMVSGIDLTELAKALPKSGAAFGRMERFAVDNKDVCLILVKNPVGMDRALDYVKTAGDAGSFMVLLNANDPDGRDVSWIWDVNFEGRMPEGEIAVSGIRRADMALRLFYAGKHKEDLMVNENAMNLFDQSLAKCPDGKCLYILPNYTAMLDLRAELAKRYGLKEFWR